MNIGTRMGVLWGPSAILMRTYKNLTTHDMKLSDKELGKKVLSTLTEASIFNDKNMSQKFKLASELGQEIRKIWSSLNIEAEEPTEEIVGQIDMVIAAVLERPNVIMKIKNLSTVCDELEAKYHEIYSLDKKIEEMNREIDKITIAFSSDQSEILIQNYKYIKTLKDELRAKEIDFDNDNLKYIMQVAELNPYVANELAGKLNELTLLTTKDESSGKITQKLKNQRRTLRLFKNCSSYIQEKGASIYIGITEISAGAKESFTTASGRKTLGSSLASSWMYTIIGLGLYALYEYTADKTKKIVKSQKDAVSDIKNEHQAITDKYNELATSSHIIKIEHDKLNEMIINLLPPWENAIDQIASGGIIGIFNTGNLFYESQKYQWLNATKIIGQIAKCNSLLDTAIISAKTSELRNNLKKYELQSLSKEEKEEYKLSTKNFKQAIIAFNSITEKTSVLEIKEIYKIFDGSRVKFSEISRIIDVNDNPLSKLDFNPRAQPSNE